MPLALTLAYRNLFLDRLRFVATLIGIVFSVVLVMIQIGLYFGFGRMVTTMIDHAAADLWVVSSGAKSFEDLSQLHTSTRRLVQAVDGVGDVVPVVIGFSDWKMPSGSLTPVFVIGSDMGGRGLLPWDLVAGSVGALTGSEAVAIDQSYFDRLGVTGIDATAEIRNHRVKVAAVTSGIRSFTTTPYVFTDLDRARTYTGLATYKVSNYIVRLKPGADVKRVRHDIQSNVAGVEALTSDQFRARSRSFWLFGTGAGAALFAGALLGIIVGTVIVSQTLYSSTKDHLHEFATLRAIGSSNTYIHGVISYQALLNAVVGFGVAAIIGAAVVYFTASTALPILIGRDLMIGLFLLTVVMCVVSAITAIIRVLRIDPAMVLAR